MFSIAPTFKSILRRRYLLPAMLFASTLLTISVASQTVHAEKRLSIHWDNRFLEVRGDHIPGGPIRTHYLEAYCRPGSTNQEWSKTVIPHESKLVSATKNRLELRDVLQDGVVVEHVIEAGADEVTFLVTATNPTDKTSLAHWAQPCMRVDTFTGTTNKDAREVYPEYIKKCFLIIDDKLTRLPTRPWQLKARYVPGQVYAAPQVDRNDVNPRPLSELTPSHSLCGCFSADEKMILAVAWEPYQEIFQGVIACIHNDFRIGGLEPGETKRIKGNLYLVPHDGPKDVEAMLTRYRKDFGLK